MGGATGGGMSGLDSNGYFLPSQNGNRQVGGPVYNVSPYGGISGIAGGVASSAGSFLGGIGSGISAIGSNLFGGYGDSSGDEWGGGGDF